jgi:hypothetical protein
MSSIVNFWTTLVVRIGLPRRLCAFQELLTPAETGKRCISSWIDELDLGFITSIMENTMMKKLLLGVFLTTLVAVSGCATITEDDLAAVRVIAEDAQNSANDAARQANEARQMASGAQSTANQALSAANAAQACCDATNEKVDRMFEASQAK